MRKRIEKGEKEEEEETGSGCVPPSVLGFHSCGFIMGKISQGFSVCQVVVFVVAVEFVFLVFTDVSVGIWEL